MSLIMLLPWPALSYIYCFSDILISSINSNKMRNLAAKTMLQAAFLLFTL